MKPKEYLEKLLEDQVLEEKEIKVLSDHRDEVEALLREEFGDDPVIKYAGSKAKGTMISDSYDLDMACYFLYENNDSLKEIRDSVAEKLREKYVVEEKGSALRIKASGENNSVIDYHIDVVPGRFVGKEQQDAFLYVAYGEKERMKTNIKTHIKHISESGCREIIKLAKLWNCRNDLHIKTFIIELFVIKSLDGFDWKGQLDTGFKKVLESFRDNFVSVRLEDPANSNNIVSQLLTDDQKKLISKIAAEQLKSINDDADTWMPIFKEGTQKNYRPAVQISAPAKPWCE